MPIVVVRGFSRADGRNSLTFDAVPVYINHLAVPPRWYARCDGSLAMTKLFGYWSNLGESEKLILSIAGGIVLVTVGLAIGSAIVSGGAVITSGTTVIAIGGAAVRMLA